MSLLINQGKQAVQANSFAPIEEKNVTLAVEKLEIDKNFTNSLRIQFRLLDGLHKNTCVFDTVSYDPTSKMAWKYQALRASAGVPYEENEPAQIDIEAILLHRVLKADLSVRKYTKDGEEKEAQNISYKRYTKSTTTTATPASSAVEFTANDADDDLPFSEPVATEAVQAPVVEQQREQAEKTPDNQESSTPVTPLANSVYDEWD